MCCSQSFQNGKALKKLARIANIGFASSEEISCETEAIIRYAPWK
jgi:hypothetical protein